MRINSISANYSANKNSNPNFKANISYDTEIPDFLEKQYANTAISNGMSIPEAEHKAKIITNIANRVLNALYLKYSVMGTADDTLNFNLTPDAKAYLHKQTPAGENFKGYDGVLYSESQIRKKGGSPTLFFSYAKIADLDDSPIEAIDDAVNKILDING